MERVRGTEDLVPVGESLGLWWFCLSVCAPLVPRVARALSRGIALVAAVPAMGDDAAAREWLSQCTWTVWTVLRGAPFAPPQDTRV